MATPSSEKKPLTYPIPGCVRGHPRFCQPAGAGQTPIEYLEGGRTIDDSLEGFSTVPREQVITFLEAAKTHLLAGRS